MAVPENHVLVAERLRETRPRGTSPRPIPGASGLL